MRILESGIRIKLITNYKHWSDCAFFGSIYDTLNKKFCYKNPVLQTVAELGTVVFNALDYSLKEEEERQLSPALENLIDMMTNAGKQTFRQYLVR